MEPIFITQWIISVNDNEVKLERQLIPQDFPLSQYAELSEPYQYTTFSIHNNHFAIFFKKNENPKSKIYVRKICLERNVNLDLSLKDEAYIPIIADIFLVDDAYLYH